MESSSNRDVIVVRQRMRFENPFALKVGQVFTGFGIGCGVGIGVGRPLNLGIIPSLSLSLSVCLSLSLKSLRKMDLGGFFKPKDGQNQSATKIPCITIPHFFFYCCVI